MVHTTHFQKDIVEANVQVGGSPAETLTERNVLLLRYLELAFIKA